MAAILNKYMYLLLMHCMWNYWSVWKPVSGTACFFTTMWYKLVIASYKVIIVGYKLAFDKLANNNSKFWRICISQFFLFSLQFQVYNSQFCLFFSRNSDFFYQNCEMYKLKIIKSSYCCLYLSWKNVRIQKKCQNSLRKNGQNCKFVSFNSKEKISTASW